MTTTPESKTPLTDKLSKMCGSFEQFIAEFESLELKLNEALAQLADALEHQEVPFHTCSGKGCKNKYCQMRQQLTEAEKQIHALIIYCDSDICHNQQDIINIKHDLVKLHSAMKPQQSNQG